MSDDDAFDAAMATTTAQQGSDLLAADSADVHLRVVAVPRDCTDGSGAAFSARPEAFLQPEVRAFTSGLVLTGRLVPPVQQAAV